MRGGARKGAGRKDRGYISKSFSLTPQDAEFIISKARTNGCTQGEIIHQLIETYIRVNK